MASVRTIFRRIFWDDAPEAVETKNTPASLSSEKQAKKEREKKREEELEDILDQYRSIIEAVRLKEKKFESTNGGEALDDIESMVFAYKLTLDAMCDVENIAEFKEYNEKVLPDYEKRIKAFFLENCKNDKYISKSTFEDKSGPYPEYIFRAKGMEVQLHSEVSLEKVKKIEDYFSLRGDSIELALAEKFLNSKVKYSQEEIRLILEKIGKKNGLDEYDSQSLYFRIQKRINSLEAIKESESVNELEEYHQLYFDNKNDRKKHVRAKIVELKDDLQQSSSGQNEKPKEKKIVSDSDVLEKGVLEAYIPPSEQDIKNKTPEGEGILKTIKKESNDKKEVSFNDAVFFSQVPIQPSYRDREEERKITEDEPRVTFVKKGLRDNDEEMAKRDDHNDIQISENAKHPKRIKEVRKEWDRSIKAKFDKVLVDNLAKDLAFKEPDEYKNSLSISKNEKLVKNNEIKFAKSFAKYSLKNKGKELDSYAPILPGNEKLANRLNKLSSVSGLAGKSDKELIDFNQRVSEAYFENNVLKDAKDFDIKKLDDSDKKVVLSSGILRKNCVRSGSGSIEDIRKDFVEIQLTKIKKIYADLSEDEFYKVVDGYPKQDGDNWVFLYDHPKFEGVEKYQIERIVDAEGNIVKDKVSEEAKDIGVILIDPPSKKNNFATKITHYDNGQIVEHSKDANSVGRGVAIA